MARKRRIEREDAIYHVLNRGNYRRSIFETVGARKAFQKALFEAMIRFDWELYGYTIMWNHYHLALRTPRGGLSKGMQWLAGTFAARFNRYRNEQGRLYQGPFKALLVEPGMHLLRLIDYIHLNPLVAGLEQEGSIGDYTWGSLNAYLRGDVRKEFLSSKWMLFGDGLEDSPAGWQRYVDRLLLRYQTDRDVAQRMEKEMTRGWCIGSEEFKREVGKEFIEEQGLLHLSAEDLHDFNRTQWELLVDACLKELKKSETDLEHSGQKEPWKVAIASYVKRHTGVDNTWLAKRLHAGTANGLSSSCTKYRREREAKCPFSNQLVEEFGGVELCFD